MFTYLCGGGAVSWGAGSDAIPKPLLIRMSVPSSPASSNRKFVINGTQIMAIVLKKDHKTKGPSKLT